MVARGSGDPTHVSPASRWASEKSERISRYSGPRERSEFKRALPLIDPDRGAAHARLMAEVADQLAAGLRVPCIEDPDGGWASEKPVETHRAADLCQVCPALAACRAYVLAHPEQGGVWGGLTSTQRDGRSAAHQL